MNKGKFLRQEKPACAPKFFRVNADGNTRLIRYMVEINSRGDLPCASCPVC